MEGGNEITHNISTPHEFKFDSSKNSTTFARPSNDFPS